MLFDSKLPKQFWAEALATAVYVKSRSPATALEDQTPYEAEIGSKPSVKHLKKMGYVCSALVPKDERKELDPKSNKCVFVVYASESKSYRLWSV